MLLRVAIAFPNPLFFIRECASLPPRYRSASSRPPAAAKLLMHFHRVTSRSALQRVPLNPNTVGKFSAITAPQTSDKHIWIVIIKIESLEGTARLFRVSTRPRFPSHHQTFFVFSNFNLFFLIRTRDFLRKANLPHEIPIKLFRYRAYARDSTDVSLIKGTQYNFSATMHQRCISEVVAYVYGRACA